MSPKRSGSGGPDDPVETPDPHPVFAPRSLQADDRDLGFRLGSLTKDLETLREEHKELRAQIKELRAALADVVKTVAGLPEAVKALTDLVDKQGTKIDRIGRHVFAAKVGAGVVTTIVAIVAWLLGYLKH